MANPSPPPHASGHPAESNFLSVTIAETTGYKYDAVGNLDKQTQANGVVVDHDYDALNRLVKITHINGANTVAQFDYGVDDAGNRTSATEQFDTDGNGTLDQTQSFDWKYDGLNRLVEEIFDGPGTSLDFTAKYTFDLASNRKTKTVDNGSNGSVDESTSYTYDANDRLQQELLDTDGLAGAERTTTYTYNNTVQTVKSVTGDITETHTYDYDAMGRMESSTVIKGGVTTTSTYTYNADGIRVQQVVTVGGNPTTTNYHIDANNHTGYAQVLEEKNDSLQVTKTYTLGHDVVAQAEVDPQQTGTNAGTALAFLYDGHGSTRALVTPAGIILTDGTNGLQLFTYDAYGNLVGFTGTALTGLLYSGELTDATTGLQYLRARYYDPTTGRFTRLDPFAGSSSDPLSLHKYLYTHSNPIMGTDPTGFMEFSSVQLLTAVSVSSFLGATSGYVAYKAKRNVFYGVFLGGLAGASLSSAYFVSKKLFKDAIIDGLFAAGVTLTMTKAAEYAGLLEKQDGWNYAADGIEAFAWATYQSVYVDHAQWWLSPGRVNDMMAATQLASYAGSEILESIFLGKSDPQQKSETLRNIMGSVVGVAVGWAVEEGWAKGAEQIESRLAKKIPGFRYFSFALKRKLGDVIVKLMTDYSKTALNLLMKQGVDSAVTGLEGVIDNAQK